MSRSCSEVAPLTAVAKSCLGMYKLDNIWNRCMVCACDMPPHGARCHTPLQNGFRNGPLSGTFPPIPATWCRQFDIDENESNCMNYKYCLVDVTRFSDSCIDQGSQLQTSCADNLNRVYRRGTPNPVAQLFWGGTFDCSGEVMLWHV